MVFMQTAAENAEVLAALAGGHDASSELFLYFTKLHIQAPFSEINTADPENSTQSRLSLFSFSQMSETELVQLG